MTITAIQPNETEMMEFQQAVEVAGGNQIIAWIQTWKDWTPATCNSCGAECTAGLTCGMEHEVIAGLGFGLRGLTCLNCFRTKGQAAVVESMEKELEDWEDDDKEDCENQLNRAIKSLLKHNGVRVDVPESYIGLMSAITSAFSCQKSESTTSTTSAKVEEEPYDFSERAAVALETAGKQIAYLSQIAEGRQGENAQEISHLVGSIESRIEEIRGKLSEIDADLAAREAKFDSSIKTTQALIEAVSQ